MSAFLEFLMVIGKLHRRSAHCRVPLRYGEAAMEINQTQGFRYVLTTWLYFDNRSLRHGAPVLIYKTENDKQTLESNTDRFRGFDVPVRLLNQQRDLR
ncbi:unnamed protein product [Arabidopsis thaliana]|uniref:Uncharacterized protein n=2 Tax=Arabidopsis thaliana TaxID=3702 RepID=A0A654ENS6_ARATH|nr:uncharacterized protein AT1G74035 [Arabidopsis thaliana]ANM58840.1 hypothetical protein AT1G74035 [Arabidopsis thaliana]CAA0333842.1 unnamed protein product [Arabidopsis thaliana]VYS50969.1 unnamed protein product [Arabidopsis thaliana]|eukprot:NP_001321249.1 hypothetical protein AT1G74035 [Arabidopsis thaliana]